MKGIRRKKHYPERPPEMLREGNKHIGRSLWSWSIPAAITCPGMTRACELVCYALQFLFVFTRNFDLHHSQYEWAKTAPVKFATAMIAEIRFKRVKVLRIHVAGDFFSVEYIRAWIRIARSCRGTTFVFYSRSWRVPELVPPLLELAALPNVWAWWSADRESGIARFPVGRWCYLCIEERDEEFIPAGIELVFRHKPRSPRKWIGTVWVCPKEQSVEHGLTCESCRQCFVPGPMPRGKGPERDDARLFGRKQHDE
jgi:hypothetical protein